MDSQPVDRRKRLLESEFFRRQAAALVAQQRAEQKRRAARLALAESSRIRDEELLDRLVALRISADTLTALSLVPLAEVAWADGQVEDEERKAILAAARSAGLGPKSLGHRLLESCLRERPQRRLRQLWEQYIRSVCGPLSAEERGALEAELLERARKVAEAAGVGPKVSSAEEEILADIARTFRI